MNISQQGKYLLTNEEISDLALHYQLPIKEMRETRTQEQLEEYLHDLTMKISVPLETYPYPHVDEDVKEFIAIVPVYGMLFPEKTYPLDCSRANEWIENQCSEGAKETARILIEHTEHVPFTDFYDNLYKTLRQFMSEIKEEPYSLITLYDKKEQVKSNYWMSQLSYPLLRPKPHTVVSHLIDSYHKYPNIHTFLFVDDGIYSGSQMISNLFAELEKVRDMFMEQYFTTTNAGIEKILDAFLNQIVIYIVSPYVTSRAREVIIDVYEKFKKSPQLTIKILSTIKMRSLYEKIRDKYRYEKLMDIKLKFNEIWHLSIYNIPIYFDHKIPDALSSFDRMYEGVIPQYYGNPENRTKLEPYPENCYRGKIIYRPYIKNCEHKVNPYEIGGQCPEPFYKKLLKDLISQYHLSRKVFYYFY